MREGKIKVDSENLMPIIKKWLYSDKDIFLRELVANGCDAVKKFQKLVSMGEAEKDDAKPRINIFCDKDAKTIKIEDNGLGMTADEVEKYITQVAFSGAKEFVERYKDKTGDDAGIIGHFGLGFYSAFMVADTVEIDTLSYQKDAKPVQWKSDGGSEYSISDGTRTARGTMITLHVANAEAEFLEAARLREILRKYCQFMPVEIYFNPEAGAKDEKPVNDIAPLWLKAPKDCTKEEYEKFYSELFLDFEPPLFWIHLNVDYPFNLKGILYFPKQSNKLEVMPGQIKLYSNQVYIADNIKEVVPEFLLLLKGVIDCPDLPLNVSRSFLQNDRDVQKISKHISKKVSDKLHEIFNENREQYNGYWEDIAPFIKYGCIKDDSFYDRVKDILLLKTIDGKFYTLADYPKADGGKIFYVSDEQSQVQYIRLFKEQGISAAMLGHIIDPHFISYLEYKDSSLKFARIDSEIDASMKENTPEDGDAAIVEMFKKACGDDKLTVKAERLKSEETPAMLLIAEQTRRFNDMSKLYNGKVPQTAPEATVVLNTGNSLVQTLPSLDSGKAALICRQIYDLARLGSHSMTPDEMTEFMKRNVEILKIAANAKVQGNAVSD